ncbi:MAG: restriction endonuclease subunit S [Candidatus Omnitrophica bacterium]|nr:restriction endonuclease subunit S [Candidatus Omnitrophota bacterium]
MNLKTNWEWKKLSDVCDKPEYGYTTSASIKGNGPKLLRTTDITREKLDWETVPYCAVNPENEDRYRLRDGDLLVSRAGSVGASIVIENSPRAVFASYLIRFRPKAELNPEFAGYFLKSNSFFVQLGERTSGTTLSGVNATNLANVKIPIPPIPVQRKIASILKKSESAKQKRKETLRLADEFLKSAFIEIFGDPCVNSKKLTFAPLSQVALVTMGQSPPSSTYNENSEGLPFFQGKAEFAEIYPVASKWCSEPNRIAQKNDILMSVRAPVGPTNIAETKCCIGRGLCAITSKKINYLFLFYQLRLLELLISSKGQGSTFGAIRRDDVENIKIIYPEQKEQQKFASLVQKVEKLKQKQRESQEEIDNLFNSLMQKAFKEEL